MPGPDSTLRNVDYIPRLAEGCQKLAELLAKEEKYAGFGVTMLQSTAELLVNLHQFVTSAPAVMQQARAAQMFSTYGEVAVCARTVANNPLQGNEARAALLRFAELLENTFKEQKKLLEYAPPAPSKKPREPKKLILHS